MKKTSNTPDFRKALGELQDLGMALGSVPKTFKNVRADIQRQLKSHPREVVTAILDLLLATNLELLLRNKYHLDQLLAEHDRVVQNGAALVPDEAVPIIRRLENQERSLLELLLLRARTLHTMQLAEGRNRGDGLEDDDDRDN